MRCNRRWCLGLTEEVAGELGAGRRGRNASASADGQGAVARDRQSKSGGDVISRICGEEVTTVSNDRMVPYRHRLLLLLLLLLLREAARCVFKVIPASRGRVRGRDRPASSGRG